MNAPSVPAQPRRLRAFRDAHRPGRRGVVLQVLSVLYVLIGYAQIDVPNLDADSIYAPLYHLLPPAVWGSVWIVAGAVGFAASFARAVPRAAFALHLGVSWGWAIALGAVSLTTHQPRGFVYSLTFIVFGVFELVLMNWPEPEPLLIQIRALELRVAQLQRGLTHEPH